MALIDFAFVRRISTEFAQFCLTGCRVGSLLGGIGIREFAVRLATLIAVGFWEGREKFILTGAKA
jgi:hypothetical protein